MTGALFGRGIAVADGAVWVSAPGAADGAVVAFDGPVSGALPDAAVTISAVAPGDIGDTVVPCGDLDGDGVGDLVIGAPGHGETGGAWWVFGPLDAPTLADATFVAGLPRDGAAGTFVACGDLTGDGVPEVVTSAPQSDASDVVSRTGTVEVHTWDGERADKVASLETTWSDSQLGFRTALVAGEDFDGDGIDDLVVGGHGADRVHYVNGPFRGSFDTSAAAITWVGEEGEGAGYALAAGDLDGDGHLDLLIGAPLADVGRGAVLVASHPAADDGGFLAPIVQRIEGPGIGDQAGFSLAVAGDVDGDGADDWLAGTPTAGGIGADAGAAYLVSGAGVGLGQLDNADLAVIGAVPLGRLGWSVAAGDLTGDGVSELVVGAPETDLDGITGAGAIYVFSAGLRGRIDPGAALARIEGLL